MRIPRRSESAFPFAPAPPLPEDPAERKEAALARLAETRELRLAEIRPRLVARLGERPVFTLELGCGHGHFLADYAAAHPGEHCVGIDLRTKRIEKGDRKRDRGGHDNLVFLKAEASEFLDALPPGSRLGKIFMLFPDPWPKKRHNRHRMLRPDMLDRFAAHAASGARLHFRTDHAEYFEDARGRIVEHPHWTLAPDLPWPFECETFFSKLLPDHRSFIAVRV